MEMMILEAYAQIAPPSRLPEAKEEGSRVHRILRDCQDLSQFSKNLLQG